MRKTCSVGARIFEAMLLDDGDLATDPKALYHPHANFVVTVDERFEYRFSIWE